MSTNDLVEYDDFILKRYAEPTQTNKEAEVLRWLNEHEFYDGVPKLYDTLESPDGHLTAILVERVEHTGTAWQHLASSNTKEAVKLSAKLGTGLRELHDTLADWDCGEMLFEHHAANHLIRLIRLTSVLEMLPKYNHPVVHMILDEEEELRNIILKDIDDVPQRRIVIHGDMHLEQVFLASDGLKFVDFENARRDSELVDVADMLRSFEYLSDEFRMSDERFLAMAEAFEDAYFGGEHYEDVRAIAVYMTNRALHELRYDLQNRQENVAVSGWGVLHQIEKFKYLA